MIRKTMAHIRFTIGKNITLGQLKEGKGQNSLSGQQIYDGIGSARKKYFKLNMEMHRALPLSLPCLALAFALPNPTHKAYKPLI